MAMKLGVRAAVWAMVAVVPAGAALGQMTGVSHPDEIPVTTSPEGISQPIVYEVPAAVLVVPAVKKKPAEEPPVMRAAMAQPALAAEPIGAPVSEGSVSARAEDRSDLTARPDRAQDHLHEDPDAGIVTRVYGPSNELPVGAMLKIRLRQDLATDRTAVGTSFTGALIDPVQRDGRVLLPAGSTLRGKITEVHGGKRISGAALIHLEPTSVTLPDGTRYDLHAQVIDTSMYRSTKVDDEGTILRKDHAKGTLAAVGLATGAGAAAGGVLGGWPGAIVGGVVGAGISTVVWLKQDRQTALPTGTEIVFSLTGALTVGSE